jgi:hypothetical protein
MKRLISILLLLIAGNLPAQENSLLWRGELYSNHRLLLKKENDWAWNENRMDLSMQKRASRISFYSNIWLRHLNASQLQTSSQLYSKDQINPWNLEIREAYAEVRGFVFDNLDLKVGRQRIVWGTADQFNPTDNLNPYDLEDVFDFGRRRGIEALNLNWHFNHVFSLQAVYIPFFRPANLPLGVFSELFNASVELPAGMVLYDYSDKLFMPRHNLAEGATLGLRFKGFALNTDFSLSYIYGRDGLPQPVRSTLTNMDEGVDIYSEMLFPRHHIIGADLAGSIGSFGVWAEAAVFIPEKGIIMTTSLIGFNPLFPVMFRDSTILKKNPYIKFIAGTDYTFRNGIYLNLQFMHGFIHARGKGNLNDYLVLALEKSFFGDRLLARPLAGGIAVSDWSDAGSNYAIFYTPEITWKGIDNLEIGLSVFLFEGKGDNIFASLKDSNMLSVKAKISF